MLRWFFDGSSKDVRWIFEGIKGFLRFRWPRWHFRPGSRPAAPPCLRPHSFGRYSKKIASSCRFNSQPLFRQPLPFDFRLWTLGFGPWTFRTAVAFVRSEEHTSELQSLRHLVCRLLL